MDRPSNYTIMRARSTIFLSPGFLVTVALLVLCSAIYLPGINGPFFFDDYTNLLGNSSVRMRVLDWESLYRAAFSLTAGPLHRPIAMASFALNYYFAGSFNNPSAFKLVNLAFHLVNGLLLYWLVSLILKRLAKIQSPAKTTLAGPNVGLTSTLIALLWLVHPIQVTSVLYVVQRMTELAATFTLLALICYMKGRKQLTDHKYSHAIFSFVIALLVFWPAALFSKENALLLPVFALVLEYTLFNNLVPWIYWKGLPSRTRLILLTGMALGSLTLLWASIAYSMPGYSVRPFTMVERLMTEGRILLFYIGLILVPRIDQFGLFHDDIAVSTSLLAPWTTLPSILVIAILLILGLRTNKTRPLLSLGILWFFAGHLLESTVFPLEIAHEHRNYLPSLGILMALTHVFAEAEIRWGHPKTRVAMPFLAMIFAATTTLRAFQWSSEDTMAYYEAAHHPDSPASQARYANVLLAHGKYDDAEKIVRRATELDTHEASYLLSIQTVAASRGRKITESDNNEILRRLSSEPISASTLLALSDMGNCITNKCRALQPYMESWIAAILRNPRAKDVSYSYFLLGRALFGQGKFNEAVDAYRQAYELDKNYEQPLLDLVYLYLNVDRPDYAKVILNQLMRVNNGSIYKQDDEIQQLARKIAAQEGIQAKR